ncbi:MAG: bifunctional adenosylcobinamide kinase/adenosylcobinamide-phosphate guanylyltransferase [Bacillaceae bacterium]|nr:bifunctional adenosylcobinamide kinase/adenosylcobinamide-phosphate guanylyltransferase [Bacillaceae bacterium]
MKLILISGGVRSGKSRFAEEMAQQMGEAVLYVATGVETDGEMRERIEQHRKRRPADWGLVEAPDDLSAMFTVIPGYDTVLIDCVSTYLSNRLIAAEGPAAKKETPERLLDRMDDWLDRMRSLDQTFIVVTSETGLGGVAMTPLGRRFQDLLGEANQMIARVADEVYLVVSGIPWRLKG